MYPESMESEEKSIELVIVEFELKESESVESV